MHTPENRRNSQEADRLPNRPSRAVGKGETVKPPGTHRVWPEELNHDVDTSFDACWAGFGSGGIDQRVHWRIILENQSSVRAVYRFVLLANAGVFSFF